MPQPIELLKYEQVYRVNMGANVDEKKIENGFFQHLKSNIAKANNTINRIIFIFLNQRAESPAPQGVMVNSDVRLSISLLQAP